MPHVPASSALARFRILDLSRVRAGPTCVRQFADFGADVIKIETPPSVDGDTMGGPRHGPDFQNLHRNKRAITLNLKEKEALAIFMKLVKTADVVVENYRPDVKFRLGIDYESLAKVNPRIILASIPASARTAPTPTGRASTRSRKAWAASCRSPVFPARARCAPARRSPTFRRDSSPRSAS